MDDDKNRYLCIRDDKKYHVWEKKNQKWEHNEMKNYFDTFKVNDDVFRSKYDISVALDEIFEN